jgi:hypothetical protein
MIRQVQSPFELLNIELAAATRREPDVFRPNLENALASQPSTHSPRHLLETATTRSAKSP